MRINCYYTVPGTQSLPAFVQAVCLFKELFLHLGAFEGLWIIYWKLCGAFIPKIHLRLTSFNYVSNPYSEVRHLYFRLKIQGVEVR